MVKRCKACKRFVAGQNGLCYKCFDKQSLEAKKNFELEQQEKRGIYSSTLNDF